MMSGQPPYPPPPPNPPVTSPRPKRRRRWLLPAAAVCAAVAGIVGFVVFTGSDDDRFEQAAEECRLNSLYIQVLDDGDGLAVTGEGEESKGATMLEIVCVFDALEMPDTVVSHIEQTRALDGTQDAEWSGIQARWTYHPDSGLSIIFDRS